MFGNWNIVLGTDGGRCLYDRVLYTGGGGELKSLEVGQTLGYFLIPYRVCGTKRMRGWSVQRLRFLYIICVSHS